MTVTMDRLLEGKRILVIEDDFYLASDEKALLERAGATVVGPFGSACTDADIEAAGEVDGAVVDINLGRGPNFDFARRLRSRAHRSSSSQAMMPRSSRASSRTCRASKSRSGNAS